MKIKKLLVIGVALTMLIIGFGAGRRITLVADEDIQVVSSPTDGKPVGVIPFGQVVKVLECEDLKHYIVPKVQLTNGSVGYVLIGKFHLIRHSAWQFTAGAISFSCA